MPFWNKSPEEKKAEANAQLEQMLRITPEECNDKLRDVLKECSKKEIKKAYGLWKDLEVDSIPYDNRCEVSRFIFAVIPKALLFKSEARTRSGEEMFSGDVQKTYVVPAEITSEEKDAVRNVAVESNRWYAWSMAGYCAQDAVWTTIRSTCPDGFSRLSIDAVLDADSMAGYLTLADLDGQAFPNKAAYAEHLMACWEVWQKGLWRERLWGILRSD